MIPRRVQHHRPVVIDVQQCQALLEVPTPMRPAVVDRLPVPEQEEGLAAAQLLPADDPHPLDSIQSDTNIGDCGGGGDDRGGRQSGADQQRDKQETDEGTTSAQKKKPLPAIQRHEPTPSNKPAEQLRPTSVNRRSQPRPIPAAAIPRNRPHSIEICRAWALGRLHPLFSRLRVEPGRDLCY